MNQISENLFTAIDIIVQERLKSLSYDKTLLCQIINNSQKDEGLYLVSREGLNFYAYSENTDYVLGDWVYVIIPENDNNRDKFIIGKYIKPKEVAVQTTSAINNLILYGKIAVSKELSTAHTTKATVELKNIVNIPNNAVIQMKVKTTHLNDLSTEGEYSLRIRLQQKVENGWKVQNLVLSSSDMLGDPFNFENFTQQEKKFTIDKNYLTTIDKIDCDLINNTSNLQIDLQDISISFGDNMQDYISNNADNLMIIKTLYRNIYYGNSDVQICYNWIKKDSNGVFKKQINSSKVVWQKYIISNFNDVSMETAWQTLTVNDEALNINLLDKYPYERYRIKLLDDNLNSDSIIFSNGNWQGADSFDENISKEDYYLNVELETLGQSSFPKNVITQGQYYYRLKASIIDRYSQIEVKSLSNEEVSMNLVWIYNEHWPSAPDNWNRFYLSEMTYGIILINYEYRGIRYKKYLPVGYRTNSEYIDFQGATSIVYDNLGANPIFNKSSYCFKSSGDIEWRTNKTGAAANQYPKLNNSNVLVPLGAFLTDLKNDFCIEGRINEKVAWIQPVVIYQDVDISANENENFPMKEVSLGLAKSGDNGEINGVFVGVEDNDTSPGIFGFRNGKKVWQLTDDKTIIGGCETDDNNKLQILSDNIKQKVVTGNEEGINNNWVITYEYFNKVIQNLQDQINKLKGE